MRAMDDNKKLWTVRELAEEAGLSPVRIRQLLLKGIIKGIKHGGASRGGFWEIPASEVARWLATRKP